MRPCTGVLGTRAWGTRAWGIRAWAIAMLVLAGCSDDEVAVVPPAATANDITLSALSPEVVVPGTRVVVSGDGFLPKFGGPSWLRLVGQLDGVGVDIRVAADFVDYDRLDVNWPGALAAGMPAATGSFEGEASVEADSSLDGLRHLSPPLPLSLVIRDALQPRLTALENTVLRINDPIHAIGSDFLLGGDEGQTLAIVEGCFTARMQTSCTAVGPVEIPAMPLTPFDRSAVVFPFSPFIAGINPGTFDGSVRLVNRHGELAGSVEHTSDSVPTGNDIVEPTVTGFTPEGGSLGQYVDVSGGGFVGVTPGAANPALQVTLLDLVGTFTPDGGMPIAASLSLVPEFVSGQLVRYVLNEEDDLGKSIDLRAVTGTFLGTATPITQFEQDTVTGAATNVTLAVQPVRQVVWLHFLPGYRESLRHFGLRAADAQVRERVLAVVRRDYLGVNIDFRVDEPQDFALFSEVEIAGADPNGIGLLGYDNTPGKDAGNLRLYDTVGGVNALTQQDGFPGYGGVFVESMFSFSQHPGGLAPDLGSGDAVFDQLFDAFRPDRSSQPLADEQIGGLVALDNGDSCPATDRSSQANCAVFALGSLIGTTVSHEIAHSLGLADPGGEDFHNTGDWPKAIMDSGGERTFAERAEMFDAGPGVFCRANYDYLRTVLPTSEPDPLPVREECF
jgi:hypothetical protein